ncbi:MAG: VWA domain-containing protein [Emcibacter sp.]|nr:VWA domain-containing protein [Emcibacter sp.]
MFLNIIQGLSKFIVRIKKAENGLILIKTIFMLIPLIGALGIGIDMSRAYLYRSKLSGALDAAALAGGKAFHSATRDDEIQSFFDSNFLANYMGGTLGQLTITEIDSVHKTLTVSARGSVPSTFMSLFGFQSIPINVTAETTSKTTGLQLVMVLDSTGSMRSSEGSGSRMDALKDASTTLINSLFGGETVSDNLEIAVVPYVTTVNVGHLLDSTYLDMSGVPASYTYDPANLEKWSGCVEARPTNAALDSSAYDVQVDYNGVDWVPFLWRPHYDNHFYSLADMKGPNGENWPAPSYQLPGGSGEGSSDAGPNINCPAPVLDFTNDKTALTDYISTLYYSYNRGGTIANLGMIWGWRMLHTGEPFFNPVAYDDDQMIKAAILMTDGENWIINSRGKNAYYDGMDKSNDNNDTYDDDGDDQCPKCGTKVWDSGDENNGPNAFDASNGSSIGTYYKGDYSGYGRRDEGRLEGATSQSATTNAINKRLAHVCAGMKGMGIMVYTITFGSGATDTTLQNLYRGCATDSGKYFHAPSSSELAGAFEAIANDLSNLRLSK